MLNFKMIKIRILALISLSVLISACSTFSGFGFFEKDNTQPPTPLVNFAEEIIPQQQWTVKVNSGAGSEYLKLNPSVGRNAIFITSPSGTVTAIDKISGRIIWRIETQLAVSAGPGAGDGIVTVVTARGHVIGLQEATGAEIWRTSLPGGILAAPAVGHGVVVVKAIDGYIRGLSVKDGHELWSFKQAEPNLILRGASSPLIRDDSVIAGFANGNLVKLSINGPLNWIQTIATPQGAFAVQRMIDIDANPLVFEHRIYVATYQGKIAALNWNSGSPQWTHEISSYTGMVADENTVYISDAKGHIWAFGANSGLVNWRQTQLEARIVSGPASMGNYVVVGDAEGYLHWLSKQDGHFVGRVFVGAGIYSAPIVENNVLYALTNNGYLASYTINR